MTALEMSFGVKLLYRSHRGVLPTQEGDVLYSSAKRILRDLDHVGEELRAMSGSPSGVVRFACTHSSARILAVGLVDMVLGQLPKIRFSLTSATSRDVHQRIASGDADLGLMLHRADLTETVGTPLIDEELVAVTAADALDVDEGGEISPLALSKLRMVAISDASRFECVRGDIPYR